MPSTVLFVQSGGISLIPSDIYSGQAVQFGGVRLKATAVPGGVCYVGTPHLSGLPGTITSGGSYSSGGLADGWPLYSGEETFIPKSMLGMSGVVGIQLHGAAGASGARIHWRVE